MMPGRRVAVAGVGYSTIGRNTGLTNDELVVQACKAALDDALKLVPDDAVAWMVGPSLSRLNADLGDLIDRADRPELAVAGRPVDVLVSQFGMAVGFDERGSLATWSPTIEDLLDGQGVVAVPVEDAARFLSGNFSEDPTTRQAYDLVAEGFGPGFNGPFLLAATIDDPSDLQTIQQLATTIAADPGVQNWIDTCDHPEGMIQYRYVWTKTKPPPSVTILPFDRVREALPSDTPDFDAAARRRALAIRHRHLQRREPVT